MNKKLTQIFLFIIFSSNCYLSSAQYERYYDGFAITIKGDTIYGKIKDFVSSARNCKYIKMLDTNGIVTKYTLDDINAYKRANEVYLKKIYDRESVHFYHSKCFMKVIDTGRVNLYRFDYRTNEEKSPYTYGLYMAYSEPKFDYYIEKEGRLFKVPKWETLEGIGWLFTDSYDTYTKIMDFKAKYEEIEKIVAEYNKLSQTK